MINKYKIIELDIHPESAEVYEDKNGNEKTIPYRSWNDNLQSVINRCKELNIPESEYSKIKIYACRYERSNDTYLAFEYHQDKSPEELREEEIKLARQEEDKRIEKLQRKQEREAKRLAKQNAIESLSQEQKEALGL